MFCLSALRVLKVTTHNEELNCDDWCVHYLCFENGGQEFEQFL